MEKQAPDPERIKCGRIRTAFIVIAVLVPGAIISLNAAYFSRHALMLDIMVSQQPALAILTAAYPFAIMVLLSLIGCYYWTKYKGIPRGLTVLGLLPVIGWIILALINLQTEEGRVYGTPQPDGQQYAPPQQQPYAQQYQQAPQYPPQPARAPFKPVKPGVTNRTAIIVSACIFVMLVILAGVLLLYTGNKDDQVSREEHVYNTGITRKEPEPANVPASAASETRPEAQTPQGSDGFYITGYDIRAVISEDNVYDITETIKVHYTERKHGIYKDIPVNSEVTRRNPDGTLLKSTVDTSVWDVNVSGYDFSADSDTAKCRIKIGSPDYYVDGDHTYVISYKMGLGSDGSQDWDEVYYNIVAGWPCTIGNVTFSLTLPKEFDKSKLDFSMGAPGTSGYDADILKYSVDGNTVSGSLTERLDVSECLTIRIQLPQGYFK